MIAAECARLGRDAADGEGLLYKKGDVKGMRPAKKMPVFKETPATVWLASYECRASHESSNTAHPDWLMSSQIVLSVPCSSPRCTVST